MCKSDSRTKGSVPLSKAHKISTENTCSRKDSKQCSVCKSCSTKTILYVCESGHVICAHCQNDDDYAKDTKKDHGDYFNIVQTNCIRNEVVDTLKQHKSDIIYRSPKDLASGDCNKRVKTTNLKSKSKSEHKLKSIIDDDNNVNQNQEKDNKAVNIKTIVEYKNVNFKDNKSSDSDLSSPPLEVDLSDGNQPSEESLTYKACPRPVVCPVLDCGKTIAMNSAMLHFYYDHPKVPRLLVTKGISQDTTLKFTDISMKTQCLYIFLLQGNESCEKVVRKESSKDILKTNFTPLLLMSARMLTKQFKSEFNKKHYAKNKAIKDTPHFKNEMFEENEILLLWMCQLEEPSIRYSITLLSKDKTYGHSYIGQSVHIRKDQDALAIFRSAESLVIHGPALNKTMDCDQLSVIISVLD